MEAESTRPKSVEVISRVWIGLGIFMVLIGLLNFLGNNMIKKMSGGGALPLEQIPPDFQAQLKPMMIMYDHNELTLVLYVAVAIFVIFSGIYFLNFANGPELHWKRLSGCLLLT